MVALRQLGLGCAAAWGLGAIACDVGPAAPVAAEVAAQGGSGGSGAATSVGPGASRFLHEAEARHAPMRRLTRAEYGNSVREVLGVEAPAASLLPEDSLSSGFTSTAGQLTTIASARRYLDAASDIAARLEPTITSLVPCAGEEAACIDAFLNDAGSRLFRRPITTLEKARYVSLFQTARASNTFQSSASLVVEALLVAPELLFVEEPSGGAPGTKLALDSWQVAARLALLLWDSVADGPLLDAARVGALVSREAIESQAQRMLQDPRARGPLRSFFDDWLELAKIQNVTRDALAFPAVTPPLLAELAEESRQYAEHVFWQDDDFRKLYVSSSRYRSSLLSAFYGDALAQGTSLARYDGPVSERSFGLLSQAGVLMTLAQSQKTAAIHRGVFVRRKLLCEPLPSPPPGLATPLPEIMAGVSSRQRISQHTSAGSCAACHARINPLGFALDRFDIAGGWRDGDEGLPLDTQVSVTEAGFQSDVDGARALSEQLAQSPNAHACALRQLFTFSLGRPPAQSDATLFDALGERFARSGFSLRSAIVELVTSDAFNTRVEPTEVAK